MNKTAYAYYINSSDYMLASHGKQYRFAVLDEPFTWTLLTGSVAVLEGTSTTENIRRAKYSHCVCISYEQNRTGGPDSSAVLCTTGARSTGSTHSHRVKGPRLTCLFPVVILSTDWHTNNQAGREKSPWKQKGPWNNGRCDTCSIRSKSKLESGLGDLAFDALVGAFLGRLAYW